jgi:hypothetical protein
LHRITDNRIAGSVLKNLEMFASLCGQKAMPNVILATTMWGSIEKASGVQREKELKAEYWRDMLDDGCGMERFENTYESAWRVVDSLGGRDRARVLLPSEIVDTKLLLNETRAGITLNKQLDRLIKDRRQAARQLRDTEMQADQGNEQLAQELNEKKANIEKQIRETAEQLRQMKIPFSRRVQLMFKGKRS